MTALCEFYSPIRRIAQIKDTVAQKYSTKTLSIPSLSFARLPRARDGKIQLRRVQHPSCFYCFWYCFSFDSTQLHRFKKTSAIIPLRNQYGLTDETDAKTQACNNVFMRLSRFTLFSLACKTVLLFRLRWRYCDFEDHITQWIRFKSNVNQSLRYKTEESTHHTKLSQLQLELLPCQEIR